MVILVLAIFIKKQGSVGLPGKAALNLIWGPGVACGPLRGDLVPWAAALTLSEGISQVIRSRCGGFPRRRRGPDGPVPGPCLWNARALKNVCSIRAADHAGVNGCGGLFLARP